VIYVFLVSYLLSLLISIDPTYKLFPRAVLEDRPCFKEFEIMTENTVPW
jgi:hypothetical protein